jgi:hypothetical protein
VTIRVPAWLDRLWTALVYLAFVFMAVIWTALWYERHWALGLLQAALIIGSLGSQALAEFRRETGHEPTDGTRQPHGVA